MQPILLDPRIADLGVVPVIAIDNPQAALPLADALIAGGLPLVEITFRTAAAAEVIRILVQERPTLLVGAGTVLTTGNLQAALTAGAGFGVAPGLNPDLVAAAREARWPFMPGVATPSEIERALALGCTTLKFFPAEALGGVPMLEALAAPYAHMGVRFVPTGGISPGNLATYVACKAVAAVGGTWIARKEDLQAGGWADIAARCAHARKVVAQARAPR